MRMLSFMICLPLFLSAILAFAQETGGGGPGGGGPSGGGPEVCECLIEDGNHSCNTYGNWVLSEIPYPCNTVICSNDTCPLSKEATKTRQRVSEEDWDTLHPKFKTPIAPAMGDWLKPAEKGYECYNDEFCGGPCVFQESRPSLPSGDYCDTKYENYLGIGKYLVCKDAQGQPLPKCPGLIP